jgi:single-strand DNA-binding protein
MLRVTLLGNLGTDPEVRWSAKGTQIAEFRVAVNQVRTGPDGERQENTEWFRVRVPGRQSEFAQRLTKGSRVLVIGRLDISHFQGKDGETRTGFDVWADDVQAMSGSARPMAVDADGAEAEPAAAGVSSRQLPRTNGRPAARSGASAAGGGGDTGELEDLPF